MAKVWKAYIKKHGEKPQDAADLMIFSEKCRTVKTLTLKSSLKVYNKHKDKPLKSKKKKSKKDVTINSPNSPNTNSKKKKKKDIKNGTINKSKSKNKNKNKASKTPSNPSKNKKKNKNKNKIKRTSNLMPSKIIKSGRRSARGSTNESVKRSKNKKKKKKKKKKKTPVSPNNDILTDDDIKDDGGYGSGYPDTDPIVSDDPVLDPNPTPPTVTTDLNINANADDIIDGVSTKSPTMNSVLAMFQKLETPKGGNTINGKTFGSSPQSPPTTQKVKKKGKRYCNFREFASGAFSRVYKAKDRADNNNIVAIKKIHIGGSLLDGQYEPTTKEEGDNEVRILKLVNNHPNTCNLNDIYFDMSLGVNAGYILCIVMTYMQYTLKDRIDFYAERGANIPFNLIRIYLFQLCKSINYMHIKHVIHRDIKPENVLINPLTNELQLCDFGCSIVMQSSDDEQYKYSDNTLHGNETYVMSRFYRAPELILNNKYYSYSADMWSLGVVISELFLGTILFCGSSNKNQLKEIIIKLGWPTKQDIIDMNPVIKIYNKLDGVYGVNPTDNEFSEGWDMIFCGVINMDQNAIDLISKILVYSPNKRFNSLQSMNHPYFNNVQKLMNKFIKNKKKKKKIKQQNVVPTNLFQWNDAEIEYAKCQNISLKT